MHSAVNSIHAEPQGDEIDCDKEVESAVVALAYTGSNDKTVMVEGRNTSLTGLAVMGSKRNN
jgi:hypothetical protein